MSNDYSLVAFRPENKDKYPRREYEVIPEEWAKRKKLGFFFLLQETWIQ